MYVVPKGQDQDNCAKMFSGYTIVAFYTLHIIFLHKTKTAFGRAHHLNSSNGNRNEMIEMNKNLNYVPMGNYDVTTLNLAYNRIDALPACIFRDNDYANARKLYLDHNRIDNVTLDAFKGLPELRTIDLSFNGLTAIDPYQFRHNGKLAKLHLVANKLKFHRVQPFLMSHSLDTLVLSNNAITEVHEITFVGLPNLKRLYLNENDLSTLSPASFRQLTKLTYLSLSYTKVHRLRETMFDALPKSLDLEETPLAKTFDPPLSRVREDTIRKLLQTIGDY